MIFVCTYLQSNQFVSMKDMRNLQQNCVEKQSIMTEVAKILQTRACALQSIGKSTSCVAVDWSTTAHVQKLRDLKSADINRLVAVMAGVLRRQSTRLEFPWKIPNFITSVNEHRIKINGAVTHLLVCMITQSDK